MAGDITYVAGISTNTGVSGLVTGRSGVNAQSGVSGKDLTQTPPALSVPQFLTTDAGVLLTTDAGVQLTTSS